MKNVLHDRLNRLRDIFPSLGVDSAYITSSSNLLYLSGYTGSSATLFITKESQYIITDFRYHEQVIEQCEGFEVFITTNEKPIEYHLGNLIKGAVAFEDKAMSVSDYRDLNRNFEANSLIGFGDSLSRLRMIKDLMEIDFIRHAANISDMAFDNILSFIKPGVTENEIALQLECFMKKHGASKLSFDSIVASGKRSSLPHGVASIKRLEYGDLLTLDFGCIYNGYCSDMTRTVVIGKATERQRDIYNIVLEAQTTALGHIKPEVSTRHIDRIARDIIKSYGYGDYFGHGLGHGVGIDIHELPQLNQRDGCETILTENMVITDEPGIYIPDFGGVRIEDLVLVTNDGYELLSTSPKELIEL